MKLIDKLDVINDKSPYSGKTTSSSEMYLRPVPETDSNGNKLKPAQRYYVFRLLNFQTDERTSPFIVRYEHVFFKKDASGKVIDVSKICCPSTNWAQKKINEKVDSDYCPICKLSKEQHTEAWKSFKTTHQFDATCEQIARDTKRRIAIYIPVLVVSDPVYEKNNNHLRVLKITGTAGEQSGKDALAAYNRIRSVIAEANEKNLIVFNGGEGANIAVLCEKERKYSTDKNGQPIMDARTGEQKSYMVTSITDVQLLSKRLHSYPTITEEAIEKLNFDDNYGTVATKDQLTAFMNENYLDTGASDSDFGDDFSDDDFSSPKKNSETANKGENSQTERDEDDFTEPPPPPMNESSVSSKSDIEDDDVFTESDLEDDIDESPSAAISRITNGKVSTAQKQTGKVSLSNKASIPPDTEKLRAETTEFSDDDIPF